MIGRAAYQEPWRLLEVDPQMFGEPAAPFISPKDAAVALIPYIERETAAGVRLAAITRHVLGLFRAVPGARAFRRHMATEAVKPGHRRRASWLMRWRWCWTGLRIWRTSPPDVLNSTPDHHAAGIPDRRACLARAV